MEGFLRIGQHAVNLAHIRAIDFAYARSLQDATSGTRGVAVYYDGGGVIFYGDDAEIARAFLESKLTFIIPGERATLASVGRPARAFDK